MKTFTFFSAAILVSAMFAFQTPFFDNDNDNDNKDVPIEQAQVQQQNKNPQVQTQQINYNQSPNALNLTNVGNNPVSNINIIQTNVQSNNTNMGNQFNVSNNPINTNFSPEIQQAAPVNQAPRVQTSVTNRNNSTRRNTTTAVNHNNTSRASSANTRRSTRTTQNNNKAQAKPRRKTSSTKAKSPKKVAKEVVEINDRKKVKSKSTLEKIMPLKAGKYIEVTDKELKTTTQTTISNGIDIHSI